MLATLETPAENMVGQCYLVLEQKNFNHYFLTDPHTAHLSSSKSFRIQIPEPMMCLNKYL